MTNPRKLELVDPLDLDDAREAAKRIARKRRETEDWLDDQVQKAADAEHTYRQALSKRIVKLRSEGQSVTLIPDIAKGDCAQEAKEAAVQAGMVNAVRERLKGLEGERSMLKTLMDWSQRMEERVPGTGQTLGKRAA